MSIIIKNTTPYPTFEDYRSLTWPSLNWVLFLGQSSLAPTRGNWSCEVRCTWTYFFLTHVWFPWRFANKRTQGSLQSCLSSDLVASPREVKSHLMKWWINLTNFRSSNITFTLCMCWLGPILLLSLESLWFIEHYLYLTEWNTFMTFLVVKLKLMWWQHYILGTGLNVLEIKIEIS